MAAQPAWTMYRAPRYLERFRCIASACEQTCCAGWRVSMDQPHYERLRRAMDHSPEERERFRQLVKRTPGDPSDPEQFATVQFMANGQCGFLDHDRLCSVQRRYGEDLLGNMCAIYPRDIALIDDRLEVTATLSCPEAAHQCLLAPDAMEMGDPMPTYCRVCTCFVASTHVPRILISDLSTLCVMRC